MFIKFSAVMNDESGMCGKMPTLELFRLLQYAPNYLLSRSTTVGNFLISCIYFSSDYKHLIHTDKILPVVTETTSRSLCQMLWMLSELLKKNSELESAARNSLNFKHVL